MSDQKTDIVIAEDDADIQRLLLLYLQNSGYEVRQAYDGEQALSLLREKPSDLLIVDLMMPKLNGYELIRKVRKTSAMPIMILSARKEDADKILGLDIGADDYVTKPFQPLEVLARVRAMLRRSRELNPAREQEKKDEIVLGPFVFRRQAMQLYKNGTPIGLTPTQSRILLLLMDHPDRVFPREQIARMVNGDYLACDENAIMVHISNIREKIEDDPRNPKYLVTIRGLGYRFESGNLE